MNTAEYRSQESQQPRMMKVWEKTEMLIKNFVWDEQLNCKSYLLQRSCNPCLIKQLYKESNQHKFPLCRLTRICKTKSEGNKSQKTHMAQESIFPEPSESSFRNCANNYHWPPLAVTLLVFAEHNSPHDCFLHATSLKCWLSFHEFSKSLIRM